MSPNRLQLNLAFFRKRAWVLENEGKIKAADVYRRSIEVLERQVNDRKREVSRARKL